MDLQKVYKNVSDRYSNSFSKGEGGFGVSDD